MSTSIGVFREGEIDGNPFLIFNFLSQIHNPSSSGGDNNLSLQPLFLCPSIRREAENLKILEKYQCMEECIPFNTPPHFPSITSVDQQVQNLLDSDSHGDLCKLPLLPLFWCNNKEPYDDDDFNCPSCASPEIGSGYYFCPTCCKTLHKECVECPLFIKLPSYPFLSLQLYSPSTSHYEYWRCVFCQERIYTMCYYCPIYKLSMHQVCAMKPILTLIDHPKRHPHSLTFFPKQNSLACDVCGEIKQLTPTYVCARCVFVVHQDCIYFPYVIRISRHQHRISFVYSLPSGKLSCGVCRQKVDNSCGAYSCNKCDDYFVHSRCALREDLWDGEELEGVPEEPEIVVEPFQTIADGIILHFSHGHNLKLETNSVYDDDKLCQACVFPIYEGKYYSCMDQCDFILHELCANCPLKKHNPLHARSLTLKVVTNGYDNNQGYFNCNACQRHSCGFVYEDSVGGVGGFRLDLRCASISEPLKYEGHEHPLFLALKRVEEKVAICQICEDSDSTRFLQRKLNCIECDFIICFECATLPYKAKYKHDKHLLTFQKGSNVSGWCEVCEYKLSRTRGFYACEDYCCTTLHDTCLLGADPYMKPGQTIEINKKKVHVLRNNTMSRPFCDGPSCCEDRCLFRVIFEEEEEDMTYCSYQSASYTPINILSRSFPLLTIY